MIFWHATSEANLTAIRKEGVIWGLRAHGSLDEVPLRCTYLSLALVHAKKFGEVVLRVEYDPSINPYENSFVEGCWQVRVYEPIDVSAITSVWRKKPRTS